jgi:transposase-like protein
MGNPRGYPAELREHAVRFVLETTEQPGSQWAAIRSVSEKNGYTADSVCRWVRHTEKDQGQRAGLTTTEKERINAIERQDRELKRAKMSATKHVSRVSSKVI